MMNLINQKYKKKLKKLKNIMMNLINQKYKKKLKKLKNKKRGNYNKSKI